MLGKNSLSLVVLAVLLLSCSGSGTGPDAASGEFLFATRGLPPEAGMFVAVTSDPEVLAQVRSDLMRPESARRLIIGGPVERGNGGHNLGWSWHFTADRWEMGEVWVEVCDGTPPMVERDLDYWVDNLGFFCPWSSFVVEER